MKKSLHPLTTILLTLLFVGFCIGAAKANDFESVASNVRRHNVAMTNPVAFAPLRLEAESYDAMSGVTNSGGIVGAFPSGPGIGNFDWFEFQGDDIAVTGITLSLTNLEITVGQAGQLTGTIAPANATNQNVTWTSSNTNIATVSLSGMVTAVAVGTATITATSVSNTSVTGIATVTVTAEPSGLSPLIKLRFNENSGTSPVNTGTLNSTFTSTATTPAWSTNVPTTVGGTSALDFGTTNGNFVVESESAVSGLGNLSSFTITGWVNCKSSTMGSGGNRIVSWINNGGDGADLVYRNDGSLQLGVDGWTDGSPAFSSANKVTTNASAPAGNWIFFAVTYQSSNSQVQFYFGNNASDATLDVTRTYARGAVGTNIGRLAIGHFNIATRPSALNRMFKGLIDEIQIHGVALTPTEIVTVQRSASTISVTGVSVSPGTLSLNAGQTGQLTATVSPSTATNQTVTWSSSNAEVATVSSTTGLVTAVGPGSAIITASTVSGGFTATATVNVSVPVTEVSVSPTTVTLTPSQTAQLSQIITPSNATNQDVTWTSSNTNIATVSLSGMVTAVAAGTATITATSVSNTSVTGTATVTITAEPSGLSPLIKLRFNENSGTSPVNTGTLNSTFTSTATTPAWSTNVPITVGGTSALDFGTTNGNFVVESESAVSGLGNLSSFTITGWVNCKSSTMGSGGNRIVSWINNGGDGADLVYRNDGSLQLGVDGWPDGSPAFSSANKVTTNASAPAGNWIFFAVTYQSSNSQVQFYFGNNASDATLDVTRTYARGVVGTNIGRLAIGHFNIATRPSALNRMFKGLIDEIQIHGVVLTPSEIVTVQRSVSTISVTGVSVSPETLSLNAGQNGQLTATVSPSNATDLAVEWSSSNVNIANVDINGVVTAVGPGTTTITVTTTDGSFTAPSEITVAGPATTSSVLEQFAFQYKYDSRRRMSAKKVPGAEWVYMVYDNRDRLVMTQDGNQRNDKQPREWTFTKYDELNRPVLTGIYKDIDNLDQNDMQQAVDAFYVAAESNTDEWFETSGSVVHGYTNQSFPNVDNESDYLTVTYYDDYTFQPEIGSTAADYNYDENQLTASGNEPGQRPEEFTRVQGQVTGSKIKNLDTNEFLWSVNYFDDRYRVIQVIAQNNKGGLDKITNVYDFVGKVLRTKTDHTVNGTIPLALATTRKLIYDHVGRLLQTEHQTGTADPVVLSKNEYNELGQLVTKNLYSEDDVNYKQQVDYRYNIRGWLMRINDSNLSAADGGPKDYFGMELGYNDLLGIAATEQYNGNISAIKWKTRFGSDSELDILDPNPRAYAFSYDPMNRLKTSEHFEYITNIENVTDWLPSTSFHENIEEYDLNGNIKQLRRTGKGGNPMDILDYSHYTGNQLMRIVDTSTSDEGFKDGNVSGDDYIYDDNGNMITDKNKNIATIEYNYLNLPSIVTKDDGQYIKYIYNAAGVKLSQEVFDSSDELKKKTDYLGEFFYENDVLQFVHHEEGRIVMTGIDPEYQYTLKDHLGNNRITFTANPEVETLTATMDPSHQEDEEDKFGAYNSYTMDVLDPTPQENAEDKILVLNGSKLDGSNNGQVGLTKSFAVSTGDVITASANAKYLQGGGSADFIEFAASLMQAFSVSPSKPFEGFASFDALNDFLVAVPLGIRDEQEGLPKGFLNILVFDKDYVLVDAAFAQVGESTTLTEAVEIRQPGYVYVFLSNDGADQMQIGFDNYSITHEHSDVIQQDDYYPFGLTFNSYQRESSIKNKYLYNDGAERQDALDLNVDATKYRMFDPAIGRWWQMDPMADLPEQIGQSPYQYGWNNPVRYNDPNGDCPCLIPAIPYIIYGLEVLIAGTATYIAYDAYDRSKFKAETLQIHNEGSYLNNSDPKGPNFNTTKKAALIGTAIGLIARLVEKNAKFFGADPREAEKALKNMSESDLQFFINNASAALDPENKITDRQFFGLINPALVNAATIYDFKKDVYSLERGLSPEEKAAQNEERERGRKANELLNNFSNAEEGTYTWNGSNWVLK